MAIDRTTQNRIVGRLKRSMAVVVVVAYLGITSWYFFVHAVGLSQENGIYYMWVWDMFPNYESKSSRRSVIGTTKDGSIVRLIPGPNDHFRWGVGNVASRLDLNRTLSVLRTSVDTALERYQETHLENPVEMVYVIRRFWSAKYNFPDDLYEKEYGIKKVTRKYWELIAVRNVNEKGVVIWED